MRILRLGAQHGRVRFETMAIENPAPPRSCAAVTAQQAQGLLPSPLVNRQASSSDGRHETEFLNRFVNPR